MRKDVPIELADGNAIAVGLKQITRGDRRRLTVLIFPPEFNPNATQEIKIGTDKYVEYQEQLVLASMEPNTHIKDVAALQALPDHSFNKLFRVADELNPQTTEGTEKK